MNEEQVIRLIRQELQNFLGSDRYTFQKDIEIFDFRNIQVGKTTGTKIATETDQKLGFFGTTPVDQPATVTNASGCAGNADTKVNEIRDRLQELGLIA